MSGVIFVPGVDPLIQTAIRAGLTELYHVIVGIIRKDIPLKVLEQILEFRPEWVDAYQYVRNSHAVVPLPDGYDVEEITLFGAALIAKNTKAIKVIKRCFLSNSRPPVAIVNVRGERREMSASEAFLLFCNVNDEEIRESLHVQGAVGEGMTNDQEKHYVNLEQKYARCSDFEAFVQCGLVDKLRLVKGVILGKVKSPLLDEIVRISPNLRTEMIFIGHDKFALTAPYYGDFQQLSLLGAALIAGSMSDAARLLPETPEQKVAVVKVGGKSMPLTAADAYRRFCKPDNSYGPDVEVRRALGITD